MANAGLDMHLVAPEGPEVMNGNGVELHLYRGSTTRLLRLSSNVFKAVQAGWRANPDVVHIHDPELLLAGIFFKILGKRVIYDAHEDLPRQILGKRWIPLGIRQITAVGASVLERLSTRVFDGIVCATPSIARRFPPNKSVVVQNFPLEQELAAGFETQYRERRNSVIFAGALSDVRGAMEMVQAIHMISSRNDVILHMAGEFSNHNLARRVAALPGWARVRHHGWVTREKVAEYFGCSRAGLLVFHPVPNHIEAQPNKLFEYMAAGLPVIASDFPLWREIIEGAGCGILVDPLSPEEIAEAIRFILANPKEAEEMGERGRHAVETRYNWDTEARKLIEFYTRFAK